MITQKTTRKIPPRTFVKYALSQLPALLLVISALFFPWNLIHIPASLKYIIILLWIVKDAAMFPLVWRSYDPGGFDLINTMKGKRGFSLEYLDPEGYIMVNGERWKACATGNHALIEKGIPVEVVDMQGLCLYVRPIASPE